MSGALAVVVLTKNSERTIEKCLNSLLEASLPPTEVIVVDGGSTDNTLKIVNDFKKRVKGRIRVKVLFDGGNGLGYARDIGWRAVSNDVKYVAMVDSDVLVDKTFFYDAVQIMEKDERLGALGAKLKPECNEGGVLAKFQVKNLAIHLQWMEKPYPNEVIAIHTACTVFRRDALEKIGGFDPYFKLAKEDSDVSFRLRKAGYKLSYLNHFVKHLETGKRFWETNFRYGRSYVLISRKHPVEGKLWTKKNIILTISLFLFPMELMIWAYYFLRYSKLEDVSFKEAVVLSLVETVRQAVRTLGMLYELFVSFRKT